MMRLILMLCPILVMGQNFEMQDPSLISSNINSEADEGMPLMSPDGKMLFFSRTMYEGNTGGKFSGHDVWVSQRTSTGWQKAYNSFYDFNTKANEVIIGFNEDWNTIFLMRTTPNKKVNGIYFSKRYNGKWTAPQLIPIEGIESFGSAGFYMHPKADVLLISMQAEDSKGEEDLYISVKGKDGQWTTPKNLGPTINTPGYEIAPFLSKDKRRLYFSSTGHGGFGDADIFVSERLYDSWETWSVPKNLGEKINSAAFDAYFSSYDDSLYFLVSNRDRKSCEVFAGEMAKITIVPLALGLLDESTGLSSDNGTVETDKRQLSTDEVSKLFGIKLSPEIKFERGSYTLTAESKELLFFMINKLSSRKDVTLKLMGYAPEEGTTAYNLELSRRRASSVRDFLVENGLMNHTIQSIGKGKTTHNQAKVEILFYKK